MMVMRDYLAWHEHYDDPASALSWRLGRVQAYLSDALDQRPGRVRVLSSCAGDGRDVLGVLAHRADAERVSATLLEIDPQLAARARDAARAAGLSGVQVRSVDAGTTDAYVGAVPADVVVMVGIFGNISDEDIRRTVLACPQLCAERATVIWSRGIDAGDRNDAIRAWFAEAGGRELDYAFYDEGDGSGPALGAVRYDGAPQRLVPGAKLFTFLR
jgi:hypothetical protein